MKRLVLALGCGLPLLAFSQTPSPRQHGASQPQGLFAGSTDIGTAQRGTTELDPATGAYRLSGGGQDVWGTADAFRFTWTRLAGDASLAADVHIEAPVTYSLAKGILMFRQSLDPGSPYADLAIHADGHVTLQYRLTQGGETKDLTLSVHNPKRLRLVRQGDRFLAYTGAGDGRADAEKPFSITVPLQGPVYVGLGVCSHNPDTLQNVTFSGVQLEPSRR